METMSNPPDAFREKINQETIDRRISLLIDSACERVRSKEDAKKAFRIIQESLKDYTTENKFKENMEEGYMHAGIKRIIKKFSFKIDEEEFKFYVCQMGPGQWYEVLPLPQNNIRKVFEIFPA